MYFYSSTNESVLPLACMVQECTSGFFSLCFKKHWFLTDIVFVESLKHLIAIINVLVFPWRISEDMLYPRLCATLSQVFVFLSPLTRRPANKLNTFPLRAQRNSSRSRRNLTHAHHTTIYTQPDHDIWLHPEAASLRQVPSQSVKTYLSHEDVCPQSELIHFVNFSYIPVVSMQPPVGAKCPLA